MTSDVTGSYGVVEYNFCPRGLCENVSHYVIKNIVDLSRSLCRQKWALLPGTARPSGCGHVTRARRTRNVYGTHMGVHSYSADYVDFDMLAPRAHGSLVSTAMDGKKRLFRFPDCTDFQIAPKPWVRYSQDKTSACVRTARLQTRGHEGDQ
jgi:hypothetical protein